MMLYPAPGRENASSQGQRNLIDSPCANRRYRRHNKEAKGTASACPMPSRIRFSQYQGQRIQPYLRLRRLQIPHCFPDEALRRSAELAKFRRSWPSCGEVYRQVWGVCCGGGNTGLWVLRCCESGILKSSGGLGYWFGLVRSRICLEWKPVC